MASRVPLWEGLLYTGGMRISRTNLMISMACGVCLLLATVGAIGYWNSRHFVIPKVDDEVTTNIVNQFRSEHKDVMTIDLDVAWRTRLESELYDPKKMLRQGSDEELKIIHKLANTVDPWNGCIDTPLTKGNSPQAAKWKQWFSYTCKKTQTLDPMMWQGAPLIHPLGGSWAYWLHKNGYEALKDLSNHKLYVHAQELRHIDPKKLDTVERLITDFTLGDLEVFRQGSPFFLTDRFAVSFAFTSGEMDRYFVYPREAWETYNKKSPIQAAGINSPLCDHRWGDQCWNVRSDLRHSRENLYLGFLFISLAGMAFTLGFTNWLRTRAEKEMERNQQLVMQTLTHELRHPVTGLRLSAETFRAHYDQLPDDMKIECLRLISLSERMGRLVHVSQQYLRLNAFDHNFTLQKTLVSSVENFLQSTLERFEGKLTLEAPLHDFAAHLDAHWVSVCVVNLVTNALTHGLQPITVRWHQQGNNLSITVQDSGKGPKEALAQLIELRIKESLSGGMGMGVSLVNRLVHLMEGQLELAHAPTRFTITLKGVCQHEASAS